MSDQFLTADDVRDFLRSESVRSVTPIKLVTGHTLRLDGTAEDPRDSRQLAELAGAQTVETVRVKGPKAVVLGGRATMGGETFHLAPERAQTFLERVAGIAPP